MAFNIRPTLCLVMFGLFFLKVDATAMTQPEQIHLSMGVDSTQMIATWVTYDTVPSVVEYGLQKLDCSVNGTTTKFTDGGTEKRVLYINRAIMTGLIPGMSYTYHVGSEFGWSALYRFYALQDGSNWSPRFAVYGDLGNVNGRSIPRIQEEVQKGMYDAILHVGDMGYDMDTDNARVGDQFMRQIEPIAAYLPYQVCAGNHENPYNFSNYVNRFSMVQQNGEINNHFYSMNIGPAHIISFSTEFYFYFNYGWRQLVNQYNWLEQDLIEATKPENRAQRPWIITMAHRPMYCSNNDSDDCTKNEGIVRKGLPIIHAFGLEDLFYKYGVDLELWAHEHSYERLWPIYDKKVYNGSYDHPYTNPKAPIHIIAGSGGCQEFIDPFKDSQPEWSAFRSSDYGYTRMHVVNKTHLYVEQVSDNLDGKVIDSNWIIKDVHGPEAWL